MYTEIGVVRTGLILCGCCINPSLAL